MLKQTDIFAEAHAQRKRDAAHARRTREYMKLVDRFLDLAERHQHPGPKTIAKLEELSAKMDELDRREELILKTEAKVPVKASEPEALDLLDPEWAHLRSE